MRKNVLKIAVSALLIALSVVLTRLLSIDIPIAGGIPGSRLGAGFLPIMLASILLGPVYGGCVGILADIIGFFVFPKGTYFPPITLTSGLVGILPFFAIKLMKNISIHLKVFVAVAITQISCSLLLQTYWIKLLYGGTYIALFSGRLPVILATIPVYSFLLSAVITALKKSNLLKNLNNSLQK